MAGGLSEAELNHILANREPYADAIDLIAIRDERAAIAARLAEITATSLKRAIHRTEIATLNAKDGLLGTAEIGAREHVAVSPVKTKVYETEMQLRAKAAQPVMAKAAPPASPGAPSANSSAWLAREAAQRKRVPTLAGDDDDDDD